ncbi:MAG: pentapeptide repeat-containing protein [Spirulina sp. SIO3F2]|nr:pentapeptide repeat-containing protein [Spirulina sp. SIO3F2]
MSLMVGWMWTPTAIAQASKYYDPPLTFTGADLPNSDFSGRVMQATEFALGHFEFSSFRDAQLQGSIFSSSRLSEADFHGADLSYGMMDKADLTGADLSDGVFVETLFLRAILDDVTIAGADFTDALFDGTQQAQLCAIATGINPKTGISTRDSLLCP